MLLLLLLMVFGRVGLLVIVLLMLLLLMVVVVTLAVTVELLVVGDDSIAPSGGRESPPENKFKNTYLGATSVSRHHMHSFLLGLNDTWLSYFRHTSFSFQGSWWHNIRRHQAQSSPSRRNGPHKSRKEH